MGLEDWQPAVEKQHRPGRDVNCVFDITKSQGDGLLSGNFNCEFQGDLVAQWLVLLLLHSKKVVGLIPDLGNFCVEFASSSCVWVGSFRVLRLFGLWHSNWPHMHVKWIGNSYPRCHPAFALWQPRETPAGLRLGTSGYKKKEWINDWSCCNSHQQKKVSNTNSLLSSLQTSLETMRLLAEPTPIESESPSITCFRSQRKTNTVAVPGARSVNIQNLHSQLCVMALHRNNYVWT